MTRRAPSTQRLSGACLALVALTSVALAAEDPRAGQLDARVRFVDYRPYQVVRVTGLLRHSIQIEFSPDEEILHSDARATSPARETRRRHIPRDVLGANGRVVLLERGTQVTGEYRGGPKQGQVRLHVLWSRARSPAGVIVDLGSPATDPLGRAGVGGEVDNHWWERFGSALLISVVGDGMRVLTKAGQTATGESFNGVGQAGNQAAIAVEQSINMPPTLHKAQGELVTIFVARDLDFSSVYRLTLAPQPTQDLWQTSTARTDGRSLKD